MEALRFQNPCLKLVCDVCKRKESSNTFSELKEMSVSDMTEILPVLSNNLQKESQVGKSEWKKRQLNYGYFSRIGWANRHFWLWLQSENYSVLRNFRKKIGNCFIGPNWIIRSSTFFFFVSVTHCLFLFSQHRKCGSNVPCFYDLLTPKNSLYLRCSVSIYQVDKKYAFFFNAIFQ